MSCVFCAIISGTLPAEIVYRDSWAVAFHAKEKAAPTHVLIAPLRHVASLDRIAYVAIENTPDEDHHIAADIGHALVVAPAVAALLGLTAGGYRVVVNTGENAGQSVAHVHLHLLGGQKLGGL